MKVYIENIEHRTESNTDFRRVVYTGPNLQLVLMSLEPGEELGEEVHEGNDQFFRVEEGKGAIIIAGAETRIDDDMAVLVPAGTRHNLRNVGQKPLKFYTLYGPPKHADGTVHHTKAEADAEEREHAKA